MHFHSGKVFNLHSEWQHKIKLSNKYCNLFSVKAQPCSQTMYMVSDYLNSAREDSIL